MDLDQENNTMRARAGKVVSHDGKPIRNFRVLVNFPRDRRPEDQTERRPTRANLSKPR
jgi:hypothetical protein